MLHVGSKAVCSLGIRSSSLEQHIDEWDPLYWLNNGVSFDRDTLFSPIELDVRVGQWIVEMTTIEVWTSGTAADNAKLSFSPASLVRE